MQNAPVMAQSGVNTRQAKQQELQHKIEKPLEKKDKEKDIKGKAVDEIDAKLKKKREKKLE